MALKKVVRIRCPHCLCEPMPDGSCPNDCVRQEALWDVLDPITGKVYDARLLGCNNPSCSNHADYAFVANTGNPEDYSYTCESCLGSQLGTITNKNPDEFNYTVFPLLSIEKG